MERTRESRYVQVPHSIKIHFRSLNRVKGFLDWSLKKLSLHASEAIIDITQVLAGQNQALATQPAGVFDSNSVQARLSTVKQHLELASTVLERGLSEDAFLPWFNTGKANGGVVCFLSKAIITITRATNHDTSQSSPHQTTWTLMLTLSIPTLCSNGSLAFLHTKAKLKCRCISYPSTRLKTPGPWCMTAIDYHSIWIGDNCWLSTQRYTRYGLRDGKQNILIFPIPIGLVYWLLMRRSTDSMDTHQYLKVLKQRPR